MLFRSVLDHADEGVGQGGHGGAQSLRQHDAAHDLHPAHAYAVTGFQLALSPITDKPGKWNINYRIFYC